jgi:hypothetical protein
MELPALVASARMRYREGDKMAQDASCRRETFTLRLSQILTPKSSARFLCCAKFISGPFGHLLKESRGYGRRTPPHSRR